jgi:hypothetical protein
MMKNDGKTLMKLVIWTQYQENYGSHDWDGEGNCPQYWKNKGGEVFVVENLTDAQVARIESQGIPTLSGLFNQSNDFCRVWITASQTYEGDETPWEDYESPWFLRYENGEWKARQVRDGSYGEFHHTVKQIITEYTLQPGGERLNSKSLYVTDKGTLTYSQWVAEYFKEDH